MPKMTNEQLSEYEKLKAQKQKQLNRQNKYVAENYDRIGLTVKKGMKAEIEKHFRACGFATMTEYILHLISQDMEK